MYLPLFFFFNDTATTEIYTLSLHDALPICVNSPLQLAELERAHQGAQARTLMEQGVRLADPARFDLRDDPRTGRARSEEHTSELQSQSNLVCRLLLEKKKKQQTIS